MIVSADASDHRVVAGDGLIAADDLRVRSGVAVVVADALALVDEALAAVGSGENLARRVGKFRLDDGGEIFCHPLLHERLLLRAG